MSYLDDNSKLTELPSFSRILHQVSRPDQHQQCLCVRDVRYEARETVTNLTVFIFRKEDLGLYGNQLNYMQTCWTVGYVIGEIPSNLLLTRVRPRYWIPAAEVSHPLSVPEVFPNFS